MSKLCFYDIFIFEYFERLLYTENHQILYRQINLLPVIAPSKGCRGACRATPNIP